MKKTISNTTAGKTPQRTCVACRKIKGKKEMVRLVRTPGGRLELDTTGKKEGRGAYLCRDGACWEKLTKGKQLQNAFKSEINRGDLEEILKNGKDLLEEKTIG